MISIKQLDSVNIKIDCDRGIAKEFSSFFTFTVPNYKFTPAYKNKIWDGKIRLFNTLTHTLYAGLLDYVFKFCEERGYKLEYTPLSSILDPTDESITDFIDKCKTYNNGKEIKPHDHQIDAIKYALKNKRSLLISPTGSGKSLIIYMMVRYLLDNMPEDKRILIVVPTTGLVTQMYNDFKDYSNKDGFVKNHCHQLYSGEDKVTKKRIVITTWQSVYKLKEDYYKDFYCVFGDECHLFKAKSLSTLMSKMKDCPFRTGTTGTLDGTHVHKLVIEGLFGKVFNVTTTKNLMDKNLLSNLKIKCLLLQYSDTEINSIKRAEYNEEIEWLILHKNRNEFISNLANNLHGNILVLFNFVDKHGIPLYNQIKQKNKKETYFISGKTDVAEREEIRKIVDTHTDSVLVASYGTCSTGINIKNINSIIFASSSKSLVRVLQSIGRGLRKSDDKDKVTVYDIADDLKYKKHRNHTLRHMDERISIYTNEKFSFDVTSIRL
jgi:superfamily II DNA or RNA helicase